MDAQTVRERAKEFYRGRIGAREVNLGQAERIASLAGGGLLAWYGLRRRSLSGGALAAAGAALLYRGVRGHSAIYERMGIDTARRHADRIELVKSVTVRRSPEEVYAFWRQLENLPRFMHHLRSVQAIDDKRSHWTLDVPGGEAAIEWDAEITEDVARERLAWASLPDSAVHNRGSVEFRPAPGDRGTELRVSLAYRPPTGGAGFALARLAKPLTTQMLEEELRRCKQILEAGEIPTTEGQPSCRKTAG